MSAWIQRSEDEPLFRVQGRAVHVTEFLILVHVAAFVLRALGLAFTGHDWLTPFALSTGDVIAHGKIWQLVTYPFVHSLNPSFAIGMVMLFWFGKPVEQALGRRTFLLLYLGLAVLPALVLLGISFLTGTSILYEGTLYLHLALFVAFAFLFPNAQMLFGFLAKWVALVLVSIYALLDVAAHNWPHLAVLASGIAVAAFAIRAPFFSEWMDWLAERQEQKQLLRIQQQIAAQKQTEARQTQSIDSILEKISSQGMRSLTRDERQILERARLELLKRDQGK